jgi:hypothetical protein
VVGVVVVDLDGDGDVEHRELSSGMRPRQR